ncbi:mannan endo-1,6-alpha-mannosidase-like protein [Ophiocordyceps camponoti-floridani]|uniref:Mannan endo-1,6-alpha-mannosidase n=1 Tax=Ophiocordyceps camponoti-floridani TaxID=2030778 RepID=A0A8H4Q5R4_9HYPO|nr:mannan endo-1,6-alpha-mannosidase-like protein [Ophiocordyceps camponoti-floridani]
MKFVKSVRAAAAFTGFFAPRDLDTGNHTSVRLAASTLAHDTMVYYSGNTTEAKPVDVGNVPKPYYWWVAGALWGAMLDYYHMTGDSSYNDVVLQALTAPTNLGRGLDFMPAEHASEEGNDDLFFWGSAVMSAAERNFPQPDDKLPSWLDMASNVFNSLISRWHTAECGGGMLWQIYASNPNGMTYKNSVSNGGLFQLAARLARATGNQTYLHWAEQAWNWTATRGLIDGDNFHVYDGVDVRTKCAEVNHQSFTYTSGIFLYGAAVLANHTGDAVWADRASRLLDGAGWFFKPDGPGKGILFEAACEEVDKCNYDMVTFKGYLARYMWQSTVMQPALRQRVQDLLVPSARAAASTCTGGSDGRLCGMRWYQGSFDNKPGLGSQMCALETIQGLLVDSSRPPLSGKDIRRVRDCPWRHQGPKVRSHPF